MGRLKVVVLASCTLFLCAMLAPASRADNWDKKTRVTFTEPIEIPGVRLPAGTYVFKLADSRSDRNMVEVLNGEEDQLIATIFTTPVERSETADHPVFELEERPSDSPMALKSWFYPGDLIGQEFTYSYSFGH